MLRGKSIHHRGELSEVNFNIWRKRVWFGLVKAQHRGIMGFLFVSVGRRPFAPTTKMSGNDRTLTSDLFHLGENDRSGSQSIFVKYLCS